MQLLYGILFFTTLVLSQAQEGLRLYDSTTEFRHFDISLNPDHTLKSYSNTSMVNTTFPLKVIENQYLKVTLLPSCGGRILSIIYKPTGHDLLYQNPVGAPYGIHKGIFYWDFLVNIGGIFPTFPEPEHGKTWDLPWDFEVVTNTSEKISIEMSFTDNLPPYAGMPTRYQKGMTLITCTVTVTVYRDSSFVEYDVKLVNNQNKPVDYEFWTDMVLAPGSTPGDTKTTAGAEIVIPINELEIDVTKWAWMNTSEASIDPQNSIFEFKNLRWYKNWQDEGIAYAYPQSSAWYGVINHDNEEGVFRVTADASVTPGIKLWTWGYTQSVNANVEDFDTRSRPFIELWSGKSKEFFTNATLAAQSTETWKEYFIPTVGLDKITLANQHGAVYVDYEVANGSVTFKANVFTTLPNQAVRGSIQLVGTSATDVVVQQWTTSPTSTYMMQGSVSLESIPNGSYQCEFVLNSDGGEQLIAATIPWTS